MCCDVLSAATKAQLEEMFKARIIQQFKIKVGGLFWLSGFVYSCLGPDPNTDMRNLQARCSDVLVFA